MNPYLAIETSTGLGSIAIGRGDALLVEVLLGVRSRHAEALMPAIDFAVRSARLRIGDLAAVVVGGGPGSFTGVRIAGATAKGLVSALNIPLFSYSGLAALAASLATEDRPVCALFDARRGEVYSACYRFPEYRRMESLMSPAARPLSAVLEALTDWDPIYAGDGALRHRERIESGGARVAPAAFSAPRASMLLWLADLDPNAGRVPEPAEWEPAYLRGSGAERGVRG